MNEEIRKTSEVARCYNQTEGQSTTKREAIRTMQALACVLNRSRHLLERCNGEEVSGD